MNYTHGPLEVSQINAHIYRCNQLGACWIGSAAYMVLGSEFVKHCGFVFLMVPFKPSDNLHWQMI